MILALLWVVGCRAEAPLQHLEAGDPAARLPMVVAVHGLGDRPESLRDLVASCRLPVRIVAPRGPEPHHQGWSWFPTTVGPQGAALDPDGVARSADRLAALVRSLEASRPTVGRPVITGFSQGGILSFAVATRHPEAVGAAVPVAGALPESLVPGAAPPGAPPIRALHGERDRLLPPEPTASLVARLEGQGWDATVRTFPGVAHQVAQPVREAMCAALAEATGTHPAR